jgi:hypothetical protein
VDQPHPAFDETVSDDTMPDRTLPGDMPTEKLAKVAPEEIETDKIPAFSENTAPQLEIGESTYEAALPKGVADDVVAPAKTLDVPIAIDTAKTAEVELDDRTVRIASRTTETQLPAIARTAEVPAPASSMKTAPGATPVRRSGNSVLKWTLIFVLILGAAGVGLFLYQQQGLANSPTTTSHK